MPAMEKLHIAPPAPDRGLEVLRREVRSFSPRP